MPQVLIHTPSVKAIVLATTLGGVTVLYFVDRKRFQSYVGRPVQLALSSVSTAVGFVINIAHDISVGKSQHEEWKVMIQEVDDYLTKTGLYEEWGADVPDNVPRTIMVLNRIQHEEHLLKDRASSVKQSLASEGQQLPSMALAERYMKFATAVYGFDSIVSAQLKLDDVKFTSRSQMDPKVAIALHCNVQPEDILVADVDAGESLEYLRHMVVVDHSTRSVVLAVRGTISITSALVDLAAFSQDFCGGHAHAGMAKMAKAVWSKASKEVFAKLTEVTADYDVVVTGHSLGAGVACLIAIMLHYEKESNITTSDDTMKVPTPRLSSNNIRCMAYAPPPVFYPLTAAKSAVANTTAYVHNMDCIPSLSVHGVRRLVKTMNDLEASLKTIPNRDLLPGKKIPPACVDAVQTSLGVPLPPKDRALPLAVPAHSLVWLREVGPNKDDYSTIILDPTLYSEKVIDLHSRMVSDHMQKEYEHALRLLVMAETDMI